MNIIIVLIKYMKLTFGQNINHLITVRTNCCTLIQRAL